MVTGVGEGKGAGVVGHAGHQAAAVAVLGGAAVQIGDGLNILFHLAVIAGEQIGGAVLVADDVGIVCGLQAEGGAGLGGVGAVRRHDKVDVLVAGDGEVRIEQIHRQLMGKGGAPASAEVVVVLKGGGLIVADEVQLLAAIQGKVGVVPAEAAGEEIHRVTGELEEQAGILLRVHDKLIRCGTGVDLEGKEGVEDGNTLHLGLEDDMSTPI